MAKVCACGGRKSAHADLCLVCRKRERRRRRYVTRQCEKCAVEFSRRLTRPDDAGRFCSRLCANRARTYAASIHADQRAELEREAKQQQHIERNIARAIHQALTPRLASPRQKRGRPRGRDEAVSAARWTMQRTFGPDHVCPNCGRHFRGLARAVYCRQKCQHQYLKKGRYPSITAIPLSKRNTIATLIALERAANRKLWSQ